VLRIQISKAYNASLPCLARILFREVLLVNVEMLLTTFQCRSNKYCHGTVESHRNCLVIQLDHKEDR